MQFKGCAIFRCHITFYAKLWAMFNHCFLPFIFTLRNLHKVILSYTYSYSLSNLLSISILYQYNDILHALQKPSLLRWFFTYGFSCCSAIQIIAPCYINAPCHSCVGRNPDPDPPAGGKFRMT